jgi:hypothetical protein
MMILNRNRTLTAGVVLAFAAIISSCGTPAGVCGHPGELDHEGGMNG